MQAVLDAAHRADVLLGVAEVAVLPHRAEALVVRRDRVVVVAGPRPEDAQRQHAGLDVVVGVAQAQRAAGVPAHPAAGVRHHLHHADGAGAGDPALLPARLLPGDGQGEALGDAVVLRHPGDQAAHLVAGQVGVAASRAVRGRRVHQQRQRLVLRVLVRACWCVAVPAGRRSSASGTGRAPCATRRPPPGCGAPGPGRWRPWSRGGSGGAARRSRRGSGRRDRSRSHPAGPCAARSCGRGARARQLASAAAGTRVAAVATVIRPARRLPSESGMGKVHAVLRRWTDRGSLRRYQCDWSDGRGW